MEERCPKCNSQDAVNIVINLESEGDPVQFFQCRDCETKWWKKNGESIALDEVLNLTARDEKN